MGKITLITSGKGGVGKSTLSASLAVCLAEQGQKTVLVDCDVGLRCADLMLDMQDRVMLDMQDVLSGEATLENTLLRHHELQDLYLLPAPQMISAGDIAKKDMRKLFQALRRDFDQILIDCPAGIGRSMKNTLGHADETIVVCTPDDVSLRDAEQVQRLLSEQNEAHPFVVFNKVDIGLVKRGIVPPMEALAQQLDMPLLGIIPLSAEVIRCVYLHIPAVRCEDRDVTEELRNIADRLEGKEIPFRQYKKSLFYRLFGGGDWT